jgi:hypothetical protein
MSTATPPSVSSRVQAKRGHTVAALCVDAEGQGYFDADHAFFVACFADLCALLIAQIIPGEPT